MRKCERSGDDLYLSLLEWRNTPSEGLNTSPTQRLIGRRTRTKLPVKEAKLSEQVDKRKLLEDMDKMKRT